MALPPGAYDAGMAERPAATIVELLERAAARFADRPALALRRDDGTYVEWTYAELLRRSRLAAWRLRALGLQPGDRLLTWSPSMPELPAVYFGAMIARLVLVPLDLRMAPEAVERIVVRSGARHLAIGTGRDAPDPRDAGLEHFPTTTVEALAGDPGAAIPTDVDAQVAAWEHPRPEEIWELVFTSGTTGTPKGVMLAHDNVMASVALCHRILPEMEHRTVSLLPLSHLLEQAIGTFYVLDVGASILYVRSRNPRVIFDAIKSRRVTAMIFVPQVLDLIWGTIEREAARSGRAEVFARTRRIARHLPYPVRRRLFRKVHEGLGGELRLIVCTAAFLPPSLQQAWEDLGIIVIQGYGSTEAGFGTCTTRRDHGLGTVGRAQPPGECRLAEDGEILLRGPQLFKGYWDDPEATAACMTADGWYRTGDIGRFDAEGRMVLMGRTKDIIVLPNGLNVYPEDIENALRVAGIRDSVVVETTPGRIEAVVLAPGAARIPQGGDTPAAQPTGLRDPVALRADVDAAVKRANATLGINQRVAGWRLWPEDDFPRTHTLKVKRDQVRAWVVADAPLPVTQGE
jgi:long-chain acyl-CoA synthetase